MLPASRTRTHCRRHADVTRSSRLYFRSIYISSAKRSIAFPTITHQSLHLNRIATPTRHDVISARAAARPRSGTTPAAEEGNEDGVEAAAELGAHQVVDDGVDCRAERAEQVRAEHGEQEVRLVQETRALVLRHDVDDVEGSPADDEGGCDCDDHARDLQERKTTNKIHKSKFDQ